MIYKSVDRFLFNGGADTRYEKARGICINEMLPMAGGNEIVYSYKILRPLVIKGKETTVKSVKKIRIQ